MDGNTLEGKEYKNDYQFDKRISSQTSIRFIFFTQFKPVDYCAAAEEARIFSGGSSG